MPVQKAPTYAFWGRTRSSVSTYTLLSSIPGHWFYLLHMHSGSGSLQAEKGATYDIHTGYLILLHSATNFLLQTDGAPLQFTCWIIEGNCNLFAPIVLLDRIEPHMQQMLNLLEKHVSSSQPGAKSDLLAIFFAELHKTVDPLHLASKPGQISSNALKYILDNRYMEPLCLDKLAEELRINKFRLAKDFKKEFGIPPIEYLLNRRIEEARKLLCSTNLKAIEIGNMVGIPNPIYFARTFKSKTSHTPLGYRQEYRV